MLAVMGQKGLEHGVNIGAAHIDSPAGPEEQNPLYRATRLGFLRPTTKSASGGSG